MVTQKLISFKVDSVQLAKLDKVCDGLGINRNKLLNFLVFYGNSMFADPYKLTMMSVYERARYFEFLTR